LIWPTERELRSQLRKCRISPAQTWVVAHTQVPSGKAFMGVSVIPHDAQAFARALYAELHRGDEAGANWIVVEGIPETPEWQGIADRLTRAAAPREK
jgi:L-threonylcarbamoyladenylate synthase